MPRKSQRGRGKASQTLRAMGMWRSPSTSEATKDIINILTQNPSQNQLTEIKKTLGYAKYDGINIDKLFKSLRESGVSPMVETHLHTLRSGILPSTFYEEF
jgi:hypothetical protein